MISVNEKTFEQEVLESPVPVLINFWAPWCGVCRLINPLLNQLTQRAQAKVKVVSINADENFKLAKAYRLTTLPTLVLLKGGSVCDRLEGCSDREQIQLILEQFSQCHTYSA